MLIAAVARGRDQAIDLGRAIAVGDVDHRHLARPRATELLDRADAEDDALAHTAASTSATSASNALAGSERVAHRAPHDQVVGAVLDRLARGRDALLIAVRRARPLGGADAGHDDEQPGRRRARVLDLVRRADQPGDAGPRRDARARAHHLGDRRLDPLGAQIVLDQAGEHGDAQDLQLRPRGGGGAASACRSRPRCARSAARRRCAPPT